MREQYTGIVGEIIAMGDETHLAPRAKSLADVLADELDGKLGDEQTQELSVAEKQARLNAVYKRIHQEQADRSAICLSGGGIRSAIFALGILQGLAKTHLLGAFDYLSTVSGGGYVGGWFTAWIKNHPRGADGVFEELQRRPDSTLNPEPQPIRHLRIFSNYLTPKTGLTSVDTWTLVASYVRNMFLNWLVLISWLAAAMMIPRLHLAAILLPPEGWYSSPDYLQILHRYAIGLTILLVLGFLLIAIAMAYSIIDVPSTGNARFSQGRFLMYRQLPLLLASLVLTEWWALFRNIYGSAPLEPRDLLGKFVAFAVSSYVAGGVLALAAALFTRRPPRPSRLVASLWRLFAILITTAFGGLCLWAIATHLFLAPASNAINYVCFAPALILAILLLVNFLFTGLASWVSEDEDREWWSRSAAWILITVVTWMVINVIVLWGAQAITTTQGNQLVVFLGQVKANPVAKALLGAFGGMTGIVAALLSVRSKFAKTLGTKGSSQLPLSIAAIIFFVLLSVVISWALLLIGSQPWAKEGASRLLGKTEYQGQLFGVFLLTAVTLLFGLVMGFFINVNKFSLHATYRSRLIRAFLGASRIRETRKPHLFTGFDPDDNIAMRDLPHGKPFHVINAALNLIKGEELAWQERKAESFTMSRLHSGSWHVGYRPSTEYGDGITLGTALTISGAAANPNMGYHSSPVIGFLMTLFNLRLGWWLGNPGPHGERTWRRSGPGYAVGPLFSEAIGNTNERYKYVNLSDGGHFENLGLYEMVVRRCKLILVIDAGQDSDYVFEDLGNAIRKIRIDLGIPIDIKVASPKKSEGTINHCAFGSINYSAIDESGSDGSFIYIKPVLTGDEPPDVANYAAAHPEFPPESTTDQWFGESQLESYRLLGLHAVEVICGKNWKPSTLPLFFEKVKKDLATKA